MYTNNVSPLVQSIVCDMFEHPEMWKIGKSKKDLANFSKGWVLDITHVIQGDVHFNIDLPAAPAWSITVEDSRALCTAVRDWVFDNVKCKEPIR